MTSRFQVALVTAEPTDVPGTVWSELESAGVSLTARRCADPGDFIRFAARADLVWTYGPNTVITPDSLAALPSCGALLRGGSGTDALPVSQATELGILVVNTPGAISEEVAEHAIALLMAVIRRIAETDRAVRRGGWNEGTARLPRHILRGRTLGLVGFGHIARCVAADLRGFSMSVLVHDPNVKPSEIESSGGRAVSLPDLLRESDYVSLHCPLLDSTRHLLGEREFALMKPSAVLVNTSRGGVVDEAALASALRRGVIAGAGLDVLEREPPLPDNPLLSLDQVVITPHIAAFSDDFAENMWRHSVDAIRCLAEKKRPKSVVNPGLTPRWTLKDT